MYTNNKLTKSIRLALMFGGASVAFAGTSAVAQEADEGADVQERIQVTGSRIKRTDLESASPITVFDAEDLAQSGHVTVEKFIHSIPSMNGGFNGSNTNNGSGGFASASLRGLGSARTLILINGRRFASGDLNSIPMSFIERIEVLRDGASTVYGSDAIAGVINFITKRDFEGAEFTAQYDLTGEGDGETTKVSGTIGHSTGRGNVVLGLEFTNRNPIWQGDRDFSRIPFGESDGQLVPAGSTANSFGTWTSLEEGSVYGPNNGLNVVDPETGEIRAFNSETDAYNFAPASYMVTPQEVFSINAAATYDLTSNLTAFLEGGFTNRQSDQLMAADGTFWGATMAADHPDNPIGEDISVARRLEETGGRNFTQDFADFRMVTGLEGYMDNGWSWDVSYNYARYVNNILDIGRANPEAFNAMLDPALCDADDACPGLWNPLEANSLTQEQLDYGTIPNSPVERGTTKQLMANLTGDTGSFGFDAGSIGWAIGIEKRWEEYSYVPDGGATVGAIYSVVPEPSEGAYDLNEAYAEVNVPLLAGMPMAETLNLTAAVRFSDYSFLDAETVTKFGIEWQPVDGLLVRATQADGFRAPSISNLFDPQAETNTAYDDPCINWASSSSIDATTAANCQAEGVPGDFDPPNNQSASIAGGNPDLGPEESDSFTAGFVYTPTTMPNFSLAVDFYDIEITNGLGSASATALVRDCYASEDFSSSSCDLILGPSAPIINRPGFPGSDYRANDGIVAGILTTTANIATFETSGVDFDANYVIEDVLGGGLNFRIDGTYLDKYSYQAQEGADVLELAGKFASDPNFGGRVAAFSKLRTNFSVGYSADLFDVSWVARYQESTEDLNVDPDDLSSTAGSVFYHDLQASYYMPNNVTLTVGARNLFDKQPPYVTNNNDMNTLNSSYDTSGQYWYARLGVSF